MFPRVWLGHDSSHWGPGASLRFALGYVSFPLWGGGKVVPKKLAFPALAGLQDLFGLEAGERFEAFDHAGEDESAAREEGNADDEKAPAGDATDVCVIELFPVCCGGVEVMKEVEGEAEVNDGGEAEGSEEQDRGGPEEFAEFRFLVVFLYLSVDASVVKNGIVVDEGIEERGGRLMGEEEEGAEDEGLDRFLDSEEKRGVLSGFGVIGREKIDRDDAGEENVAHSDGREGI